MLSAATRTEKLPSSGKLVWLAVINQAFNDLSSPYICTWRDAVAWLIDGDEDRDEVCRLAGLDPGYVVSAARKRLNAKKEAA